MQRVYQAANNIEAHMVVHLLEQAGLHAHVQGEHLQSGAGELPLGNLVAVAVADEDVSVAREVIREWEARVAVPDTPGQAAPAKSLAVTQGLAFFLGALLAGGIVWSMHNGPEQSDAADHNQDGTIDERAFYSGKRLVRIETDRNFDTQVDAITEYDTEGFTSSYRTDDDFNGTMEATIQYRDGQPEVWEMDMDGDGKINVRSRYQHGVVSLTEYLDQASGDVRKKVTYSGNKPDRAYLDLDGDGNFERSYRFNAIDEPVYLRDEAVEEE